jgi:hypothetical protein
MSASTYTAGWNKCKFLDLSAVIHASIAVMVAIGAVALSERGAFQQVDLNAMVSGQVGCISCVLLDRADV